MKISFSFFTIVLIITNVFCQNKVEIEYEFRNEFDISNIKDPKSIELYKNSNNNRLYFKLLSSSKESVFKKNDKIDNSQSKTGASISFTSGPGGIYYKNLENKQTISKINYNGKNLLVIDSIKNNNWILHKEKNELLGFEVKKATLKESQNTFIEAWYATNLKIKNGPSNYDGLPGLILKLVINNKDNNQVNKQIYLATEVKLNDKTKIDKPIKGEQISQSDFDKLVKKDSKKFYENIKLSIEEK